jgi:hypothetical protein
MHLNVAALASRRKPAMQLHCAGIARRFQRKLATGTLALADQGIGWRRNYPALQLAYLQMRRYMSTASPVSQRSVQHIARHEYWLHLLQQTFMPVALRMIRQQMVRTLRLLQEGQTHLLPPPQFTTQVMPRGRTINVLKKPQLAARGDSDGDAIESALQYPDAPLKQLHFHTHRIAGSSTDASRSAAIVRAVKGMVRHESARLARVTQASSPGSIAHGSHAMLLVLDRGGDRHLRQSAWLTRMQQLAPGLYARLQTKLQTQASTAVSGKLTASQSIYLERHWQHHVEHRMRAASVGTQRFGRADSATPSILRLTRQTVGAGKPMQSQNARPHAQSGAHPAPQQLVQQARPVWQRLLERASIAACAPVAFLLQLPDRRFQSSDPGSNAGFHSSGAGKAFLQGLGKRSVRLGAVTFARQPPSPTRAAASLPKAALTAATALIPASIAPMTSAAFVTDAAVLQLQRYKAGAASGWAYRQSVQLRQAQVQKQIERIEHTVHTKVVREIMHHNHQQQQIRNVVKEQLLSPHLVQILTRRIQAGIEQRAGIERYRKGVR